MSLHLAKAPDGLRTQLSEDDWSSVVVAADPPEPPTGALAPLPSAAPGGVDVAEPLAAAARLALGTAGVRIDIPTGAGDRGLVAQIGCDAVAAGVAVRALVAADDGSGPLAVPGVEIGVNEPANVVAEIMRLFPGGGLTRHTDGKPVTLPHELSLTLHQAVRSGDDQLAGHVAEQAGWAAPPEVLVALATGTTASATVTVRVAGSPTTVIQQWLLCDVGWVLLTVRGTHVTHTVQSRDEVRGELVSVLSGALAAALAVGSHG